MTYVQYRDTTGHDESFVSGVMIANTSLELYVYARMTYTYAPTLKAYKLRRTASRDTGLRGYAARHSLANTEGAVRFEHAWAVLEVQM